MKFIPDMLEVKKIVQKQAEEIRNWHEQVLLTEAHLPMKLIEENNHWNYLLWHEEDIARITDIAPEEMVLTKRNIDRYNQQRNNSIEQIDEWILNYLESKKVKQSGRLHSETPGMMIDRLSIMGLKLYHMVEESVRPDATLINRALCKEKAVILQEQINDLSSCLADVVTGLERGMLKLKVYRQLKMYNDPDLNPQLYKKNAP